MASPLFLRLLFFLSFSLLLSSSSALETPVSLRLRRLSPPPQRDPFQRLADLASASLLRATRLRNPRTTPHPTHVSLYSHSFGGYSLDLSFGNPPQELPLVLDTGSHLTWLPCTRSYQCRNCPAGEGPAASFLPKNSTSARVVGCRNPKCAWIHPGDGLLSRCQRPDCSSPGAGGDCPQICPPYVVIYGSGSTAGLLLSETLVLPGGRTAAGFAVGCSVFSDRQPTAGIAGFGRGSISLPAQLGLKRFSYCLISRRFDDESNETGSVILEGKKDSSKNGVNFTPFLKNPATTASGSPLSVYYYVGLRKITVGGRAVKIPYETLTPDADGNGGAIIDSGTTFTYLAPAAFRPVAAAFAAAFSGRLNRSVAAEDRTGLRPCFSLPTSPPATVSMPELVFHFKGGAEMRLPPENYLVLAGPELGAVCLALISDDGDSAADDVSGGPAIILGSFQQQNYYMVFDLERERLGFRPQSCLGS